MENWEYSGMLRILGRMEILEILIIRGILGILRIQGILAQKRPKIRFWMILDDFDQLKKISEQKFDNFLHSNAF